MSTMHTEYTQIKATLQSQIAASAEKIDHAQAEVSQIEEALRQLAIEQEARHASNEETHAKATLDALVRQEATHRARLEHARGTSLEPAASGTLIDIQSKRNSAEAEVRRLREREERAEQARSEQVQSLAQARSRLLALHDAHRELMEHHAHFDREHATSLRQEALATLSKTQQEITRCEQALAAAHASRARAQESLARLLAPWPELASSTLLAHGTFGEHPASVALSCKKQLIETLEQGHHPDTPLIARAAQVLNVAIPVQDILAYGGRAAHRERMQQGFLSNPIMSRLGKEMEKLEETLADIERLHRESCVRALMEQVAMTTQG